MKKVRLFTFLIITALLSGIPLKARSQSETFAQKQKHIQPGLYSPERITIGAEDNFQPQVNPEETNIYYTKRIRLSHKIYRQNIKTGISDSFIEETANSKDPALSPDGNMLAFSYFKYDAKGDICFINLKQKDQKETCITDSSTQDSNPFWIKNNKIGYLVRTQDMTESDIMIFDLKAHEGRLLFSANILNPKASIDGNYLTYVKVLDQIGNSDKSHQLVIRDLQNNREYSIELSLPGISSFPVFDVSGKYIYFGHFMNDTSGDLTVDSFDRAVILRIKTQDALKGKKSVVPEPVTSLEHNCNFPLPTNKKLFLTCAFNESLDVYTLPLEGVIPSGWHINKINEALKTARSYEDRILMLLYLAYNNANYRSSNYLESLLSNHYLMRELKTSLFLSRELGKTVSGEDILRKSYFSLISDLIESEIAYEKENKIFLSAGFKKQIIKRINEINSKRVNLSDEEYSNWVHIVRGCLEFMRGKFDLAKKRLTSPGAQAAKPAFIQYIRGYYLKKIYEKFGQKRKLAGLYREMALREDFDDAAKVYYSYNFLELLDSFSESRKTSLFSRYKNSLKEESTLKVFFSAEEILNAISASKDNDEAQKNYNELYGLLKNHNEYFLKRALFVRSINRLSSGNKWRYMYYIANYWLTSTEKESIEYSYARDQYLYTSLEKAYGLYGEDKISFAADEFYIALRLTDNLETHHGFIHSMLKESKKSEINPKYDFLAEKTYTDEKLKYKDAYLLTVDNNGNNIDPSPNDINRAISLLESMIVTDDSSGANYLLLGYLYFKNLKLAQTPKERKDITDKSHRNLMLALDFSRYNTRIKVQALINLGLLHQYAGNYGESLSYFNERAKFPFGTTIDEIYFMWFYAKANYYTRDYNRAFNLISEAIDYIEKVGAPIAVHPFIEKAAFYSMADENYKKSQHYYFKLTKKYSNEIMKDRLNHLKILSSYGFVSFKNSDFETSGKIYKEVYDKSVNLQPAAEKPWKPHIIPSVYSIQALGFLAQMEKDNAEKIRLREKRLNLLLSTNGNTHGLGYSKDDWHRFVIKEINSLSKCYLENKIADKAFETIILSVPHLESLFESTLNPLEDSHEKTLRNIFAITLERLKARPLSEFKEKQRILKLASSTENTLSEIKEPTIALRFLKFSAERRIFEHALDGSSVYDSPELKRDLKKLFNTYQWKIAVKSADKYSKEIVAEINNWAN